MALIGSPVRFSNLKQLARSPAHYKWACENPIERTRAMRIGSAVNLIVLKKNPVRPIVVFPGNTRRGADWKLFESKNLSAEILTQPEWDEALPIGEAVLRDPVAQTILNGARYEVPLRWSDNGIDCETLGIDIVGPGYLADLKVVHNAEPEYLQKHAYRMAWDAQLEWYFEGATQNQIDVKDLYLLCVESSPPHCVVVLRMTIEMREVARKRLVAWIERLKVCAESNHYSGYTQAMIDWTPPEWLMEFDDGEE